MLNFSLLLLMFSVWACTSGSATISPDPAGTDFHVHIHSPPDYEDDLQFNAKRGLFAADSIGVSRALVLPNAYGKNVTEPYAIQENNFVHAEASQNRVKLAGACTVNPAKNWAMQELKRCAGLGLKVLKLHFMASGMDLKKKEDYEIASLLVAEAAKLGMTILVHANYPEANRGKEALELRRLIESYPQVRWIIGHLFGREHAALRELKHPNFVVEVSIAPIWMKTDEARQDLVKTIRQVGIDKFVFGSDWPAVHPAEMLKAMKALSLTEKELNAILYTNAHQLDDLFAH